MYVQCISLYVLFISPRLKNIKNQTILSGSRIVLQFSQKHSTSTDPRVSSESEPNPWFFKKKKWRLWGSGLTPIVGQIFGLFVCFGKLRDLAYLLRTAFGFFRLVDDFWCCLRNYPLKTAALGTAMPYTHAYMHTHTHTHMQTYIHTYTQTYITTWMRACMHTYIHTYIHACMHACIRTYIHTCIHT